MLSPALRQKLGDSSDEQEHAAVAAAEAGLLEPPGKHEQSNKGECTCWQAHASHMASVHTCSVTHLQSPIRCYSAASSLLMPTDQLYELYSVSSQVYEPGVIETELTYSTCLTGFYQ